MPPAADDPILRRLERHELAAYALAGRELRDLGDAVLLHDPIDREPFWNRLGALDLPDEDGPFDRRLGELITLMGGLGRRPHLVVAPSVARPVDLGSRLRDHGFRDVGGGRLMVLDGPVAEPEPHATAALDASVEIERHVRPGARGTRLADEAAELLCAAFDVDPLARPRLATDLLRTFDAAAFHLYLVRVEGLPVAVAKRTSFDGATHLSSIGTRPGWRGRGLGTLVTAAAARDATAEGCRWTYLTVFPDNRRAIAVYDRLGFRSVDGLVGDFVLG
jgi:ribosomal protein S18 acetylase RimI-like enzyme